MAAGFAEFRADVETILGAGDKVVKYGAPIGSIVNPTAIGGWVHVHTMKSDYIASHTREAVREGGG